MKKWNRQKQKKEHKTVEEKKTMSTHSLQFLYCVLQGMSEIFFTTIFLNPNITIQLNYVAFKNHTLCLKCIISINKICFG